MRCLVERHRSRATFRFQYLNYCQFVGRFFFGNRRCSIATRCERELRCVIEGAAVDAGANRDTAHHLSAFGIEHHHHFVVAAGEQTMMPGVQSDAARLFSRRQRPPSNDLMCRCVDDRNFTFVFDVAIRPAALSTAANSGLPPS